MKLIIILILIVMAIGALYVSLQGKYHFSLPNVSLISTSSVSTSAPAAKPSSISYPRSTAPSIVAPYLAPAAVPAATATYPATIIYPATTTYLPQISDQQIPKGFKREDLSPYFYQIRISAAYYSAYSSNPSQIRLTASFQDQNKTVDVSGWTLRSNLGSLFIPNAIALYNPMGPFDEGDIVLGNYQSVIIYSNTSAVGKNFRPNKCTGYLTNLYTFTPPLSQNCPLPYNDHSEIAYLFGYCQNYIMSLSGCRLPETNFYNNLPGTTEGNLCRAYLDTVNQSACLQKHKNDSDFLSNDWLVWINNNKLLDPYHNDVRLFDKNGLLVDEYNY